MHGLIPPIRKHVGDENLERIAFGLKEGEISPVIQVANQYVILKCEKHMAETYIADRFRSDAEALSAIASRTRSCAVPRRRSSRTCSARPRL